MFCQHTALPACKPVRAVAQGGPKRVEGPLELDLEMDVSSHVGARNQTQVL